MKIDAESLIKAVTGGGPDEINALLDSIGPKGAEARRLTDEQKRERERLAYSTAALFSTVEGREVLEHLLDATLRRVTFDVPRMHDPQHLLVWGAFREGQNATVAELLRLIGEGGGLGRPRVRVKAASNTRNQGE